MEDEFYRNSSHFYIGPKVSDCVIFRRNTTLILHQYNGIPDNLIVNSIAFVLLVILFGLLRKKAWNYGRLALLHKTENRWMELFYGEHDTRDAEVHCIEASVNSHLSNTDRGFLSWIVTAFKLPDDELLKRAGPDGLLYVSFQRHLMALMAIMMLVSICVILPINFHGDKDGEPSAFGHTTISNLDSNSSWLWVHTLILISYLPIGACVMRRFVKKIRDMKPAGELAARTLLITEIPKHQCKVDQLTTYFKEAFPTLTVEDVTLAYDIKRLTILDAERDCAEQARLYCENYNRRKGPLKLYPRPCGQVIGCCFKQKQVDALEFYIAEEARLTALVEEERKVALSKPIGVAFVTLGTPGHARTMRRELRQSLSIKWIVDYAPAPSDIYWENLSIARPCWYFNAILINSALCLVLFFLTTPAVVVTAVKSLSTTNEITKWSPLLSAFLPTVLLVTVAALMPALVGRSELLVRHWTRSGLNGLILRKTLLLLLLMVLILPSLGLTSASAFFDWTIMANDTTKWECVFLPDQGALFVNYVITAALLGSGLELVRFPELAVYTFRLCVARSRAERIYVRKAVLWEFPLGAHYAWLLLVFTMTTVYSIASPLITPFGLLYLSIKHLVDRHNLCFVYGPAAGGGQLAGTAASAAGAAPILAQIAFLALGLVRQGLSPMAAVQLSGLAINVLGFVTGVTLPASKPKHQASKRDFSAGQHFVAPVLRKKLPVGSPEETISVSTSVPSSPSTRVYSTNSSAQGSPKLYQDYGRTPTNV
ncbi:calcium permeable stress-gated cation channel 1 [Phymastichus coffea]|uniref:calcium permeable stress-gated cation channel 1 n=1 Tax=Phymastichus coffea TaxID=108790 RepID=UPI00273C1A92|nr:calcium permeable stress-gated cation channel 1 [Phymastichus coffea]